MTGQTPVADDLLPELSGPAPCDGCELAVRCGAERLTCRQFADYVETGTWSAGPRTPTAAGYRRLFSNSDDAQVPPARPPKAKRSAWVQARLAAVRAGGAP